DPARALQARQLLEHGRPAFRIVARRDDALGLVEHEHLRMFGAVVDGNEQLAVELDAVAGAHARSELGDLAVDADFAGVDAFLKQPARTESGIGEDLLQALLDRVRGGRRTLQGQKRARWRVHSVCSGAGASRRVLMSSAPAGSAAAACAAGGSSPIASTLS